MQTTQYTMKAKKLSRLLILFALLGLYLLSLTSYAVEREVYIGGFPFGIKMETDGVIVTDVTSVNSTLGKVSPAKEAGIVAGDVIISVSGKKIEGADELQKAISESRGKMLKLEIKRGDKTLEVNLIPVMTSDKKGYKSGLFIKDSAAGIGTVTFVKEDKKTFGGLGHGVSERNTGALLPLKSGSCHSVTVNSVTKGSATAPGELKGVLDPSASGTIIKNTEKGVFGVLDQGASGLELVEVAEKGEIKTGKCSIYTCLKGDKTEKFDAEIVSIINKNSSTKNFIVALTDKKALEKTGGIVQGMSGSPIVQNGKLVGAVTHVLMRDQTQGYGIFIENMLEAANQVADEQAKKDAS